MQGLPDFEADELWRGEYPRFGTRPVPLSFVDTRGYRLAPVSKHCYRSSQAREESSGMHLMGTLVLLLKGAIYFETRKHYVVVTCTTLLF